MNSSYNDLEMAGAEPSRPQRNKNNMFLYLGILAGLLLIVGGLVLGLSRNTDSDPVDKPPSGAAERARWLMQRHLTIDGHNDLPHQYRKQAENHVLPSPIDLTKEQEQFGLHTDIPKLKRGLLTGQFWSVYVDCSKSDKDAVRATLEQIDVMERIIDAHPDVFERAFSADDIERSFQKGLIGSVYGIEGGHQIDSSMAALRLFYNMGVRYMTLTHNCDTPWSRWWDSEEQDEGLTVWGKKLIREMNRMGMFVDLSHVNKQVMLDVLQMDPPAAPVMFSHSSAYSVCNHGRNVPDDVLEMVQENGGIVMINFSPTFINCDHETTETTIDMVVDHIEHIKNVSSVDIIGLGGDYDGIKALPSGLEDVSKYPDLVARMIERGFTDEEVVKIMGGNLLRAMRGMEAYRDAHKDDPVEQEWISPDAPGIGDCRTAD